jgi:hypothetical protein
MRRLGVVCLLALVCAAPATASEIRLPPAQKRAVDRVLTRFVDTAVKRRDVAASYGLVTSNLRGGTTRAAWAKGDIPVYPYPARGSSFGDYYVDYAQRNDVALELTLQPRPGAKADPTNFSVELLKVRGRWLVDSFYPVAIFESKKHLVSGPRDFAAPAARTTPPGNSLNWIWWLAPASIVALIVGFPLVFFVVKWRRDVRAYRAYYSQRL